jgi:NAD(P)-dependent dehydrogenase (short-subunit alcohol dehydrogenase family)
MFDLDGSDAVVTGGSRGIGLDAATALAQHGCRVVSVGRQASAASGAIVPFIGDVTDAADMQRLAGLIRTEFGSRVDIIVGAAGLRGDGRPVADTDLVRFSRVMDVSVMGCLLPIRALLPFMTGGSIVLVSGVFGLRGRAGHAAGATAKWALEGLMRTLALELGPRGIRVNAVCPGFVEGANSDRAMRHLAEASGMTPDAVRNGLIQKTALGRFVTSEDVANAVLFLASRLARSVTGQDIVVDAGWTLLT